MKLIPVIYGFMFMLFTWASWQAWRSANLTATTQPLKAFILLCLYYWSLLLFPWVALILVQWWQSAISDIQAISMLVIAGILIYARFIEPYTIVVKHTDLSIDATKPLKKPIKIALIADLHIGLYSGREKQLALIVEKINQQDVDFVVVSGDWTYEPEIRLVQELDILKKINVPVYSVNGNHDEQYPGPPIQALLAEALEKNDVIDIENKVIEFDEIRLIGIGDLWAGKADLRELPNLPQDKLMVLLSHNPDTVEMVPALSTKPLMLSGHTHGGQIELPFLTDFVLKKVSMLGHKRGYYQHETANVFVTVGTGMVGAPFRFRVPPTIDVLQLH